MGQNGKKRRWLVIVITLAIAYVLFTRLMPQGGPGGWGGGGAPAVSVAEVVQRNVREWHDFSGRITPVDQAEVRPRVSGVIQEIRFKEGAEVNAGDVLFVIDPRPYAAAVTGAEGTLGQANAQFGLAKSDLNRAQILIKDKAIPQHEFDTSKNAYNVAEANAKTAQAALDVAELNFDYAYVKAPISGRVSRAEITVGNLVEGGGSNAPILTTIVANGQVYADFDIDEATFMPYAKAGLAEGNADVASIPVALGLTGETGYPHTGHLLSFDNKINLASGTIRARGIFDNADGQLLSGMFAHVRIGAPAETPALLITERAIGTDQSKKFVIVVAPDNKTEHREITLGGLADDGLRIVTSGLKPGEKIIVSGTQRVMMPGQPVTPELVNMDYVEPPPGMPGMPPAEKKPEAAAETPSESKP